MITTFIWIFIVSICVFMLELIFNDWGFLIPGMLFLCFYFSVSYSTMYGVVSGALVCVSIELFMGRQLTALPLLVPLVFYARFWRRWGNRRSLIPQCASGAAISLAYEVYCYIGETIASSSLNLSVLSAFFLPSFLTILISAAGFPILICILDVCSKNAGMKTFRME